MLPLDVVCLVFMHLSIYYCNEIKLGFSNTGQYRLKQEFVKYFIQKNMILLRETIKPNSILKKLLDDQEEFASVAQVQESPDQNLGIGILGPSSDTIHDSLAHSSQTR